jgi:hypothetical protein
MVPGVNPKRSRILAGTVICPLEEIALFMM